MIPYVVSVWTGHRHEYRLIHAINDHSAYASAALLIMPIKWEIKRISRRDTGEPVWVLPAVVEALNGSHKKRRSVA